MNIFKIEDNSISAVLYNFLRQENIDYVVEYNPIDMTWYLLLTKDEDFQKVLDFLPEEKKILEKIEEEAKKIPEYDRKLDNEIKKSEKKKGGRLF